MDDPQAERNEMKRNIRFGYVIARYEGDGDSASDTEIDMNESSNDLGPTKKLEMSGRLRWIACENGIYIKEPNVDAKTSAYHELEEKDLIETYGTDYLSKPCSCVICKKREENRLEMAMRVRTDEPRKSPPSAKRKGKGNSTFAIKHGKRHKLGGA